MILFTSLALVLIMPLLITGFINKIKAFWAGKQGASVFQGYYDFIRLTKKSQVISNTTGPIFKLAPTIYLATLLTSTLMLPLISGYSILNFKLNFVVFCYLLGLGRFFMLLGALDTGSGFEGMGANREITFSLIAEPALFILFSSLTMLNQNIISISELFSIVGSSVEYSSILRTLIIIILFIIALTETCRVPVDDPKTHLELTMIHEVMILDYSGIDLGFIHFASGLKIFIFNTLMIGFILSPELSPGLYTVYFILLQALFVTITSTLESCMARFRMTHIPQFIFMSVALSITLFAFIIIKRSI